MCAAHSFTHSVIHSMPKVFSHLWSLCVRRVDLIKLIFLRIHFRSAKTLNKQNVANKPKREINGKPSKQMKTMHQKTMLFERLCQCVVFYTQKNCRLFIVLSVFWFQKIVVASFTCRHFCHRSRVCDCVVHTHATRSKWNNQIVVSP